MENSGLAYLLSTSSAPSASAAAAAGAAAEGGAEGAAARPAASAEGAEVDAHKLADLRRMYTLFALVRGTVAWRPAGGDGKERVMQPIAVLR